MFSMYTFNGNVQQSLLKKDALLVRKRTAVVVSCLFRRHNQSKTGNHSPVGNIYRHLREKVAILLKLNYQLSEIIPFICSAGHFIILWKIGQLAGYVDFFVTMVLVLFLKQLPTWEYDLMPDLSPVLTVNCRTGIKSVGA